MICKVNRLALGVGLVIASLAGSALAQTPSQNATVNLIRLLVQQGVLKQDQAQALIDQAEAEATQARQTAANTAPVPAPGAPGEVRVQYVPAIVREQIRDQVKAEVIAQAKQENWAQPNTFPDWVSRITFEGDVRLRNESRFYSGSNSNEIVDFAELNNSGPYDVNPNSGSQLPPLLNTREDRENMLRLRARMGMRAALSPQWTAAIRLGTGSDSSPVSTTQTLGGGFDKKDLWLDQGYLNYRPTKELSFTGGRMPNPFMSTDLLYSNDLNFDGLAGSFNHPLSRDLAMFGTLGAFPVEYSSDSASSDGFNKEDSENKWLYGAQLGASWAFAPDNNIKGALAYYQFDDIEGRRSNPCAIYDGAPACDSDETRPAFMQKGNTLMELRDLVPDPSAPTTSPQPQFVGLASEFNVLDLNLVWDTLLFDDLKLRSQGNYLVNLGYDEGKMRKRSAGALANNLDENGDIESGDSAWMLQFTLGSALDLKKRGDWNLFAGYKYIEPDALPDGFNDSSFHLGGTNAKGYFLGGNYGIEDNVLATARWLSSEEVYGAPFAIDVLQLELNTRF
ncbi:putative porin [Pseudomonas sp. SWRI92]|uniref:Porin n=1 Tax=Pseudomonas marvdashtae TaxID=2745500 RepID=A0A923JPC8_9PSED|nr:MULTISPECIES: putative porin [Pseudomonas]MBC3375863.1 putative porin [Pseudomonas sp. SWRI92]MBV4552212.1 putative porin [Pseudomonas marvdashtae]